MIDPMKHNDRPDTAQQADLTWSAIRTAAGLTQEQLARRFDVGTATLRRFERGATEPQLSDLMRNRLALLYRDLERNTAARLAPTTSPAT